MKKIHFFWLTIFLFTAPLFSQSDSLLFIINDLSENDTYLDELILELKENPVNINTAMKDELMQLPLVNSAMADSILTLRAQKIKFKNKRQIRPALSEEIYEFIKDLITVSEKKTFKTKITQRTIYRVEAIPEIENGKFMGNAFYNYSRVVYQYNPDLKVGMIIQKDPGEQSYTDHLNIAAEYHKNNWHLIAGNYYLQFGMGLTHSNPYGKLKSVYIPAVFRESLITGRPNLSSSESSGKFGVFVQNNLLKSVSLFAFYSGFNRDVSLQDNAVTSLRFDGYHRSESELNSRERLFETNWGSGIFYTFHLFRLGVFYNTYQFDPAFENTFSLLGDGQKRRQYFAFNGTRLAQAAVSIEGQVKNISLSAEYSHSFEAGTARAHSIFYNTPKLRLGLRLWNLDKDFQSVDGRSFDNSAAFPSGVQGYFSGIQYKISDAFSLSAYKQFEKETWRTYFDPMPASNKDWLAQLDWRGNKISGTLRFRNRTSEELNTNQENPRLETNRKSIRVQLTYSASKRVGLKTRLEHTFFERLTEKGTLIFQDITYRLQKSIALNARFSFFRTTSYNSRIYEYERDLPGSFSNIALFDNGSKMYFLIKWKINDQLSSYFKWRYVAKYRQLAGGRTVRDLTRDLRMQMAVYF